MSFNQRTIQPITISSKPNTVDKWRYGSTNTAQIISPIRTQTHYNNQYQMKPIPNNQ